MWLRTSSLLRTQDVIQSRMLAMLAMIALAQEESPIARVNSSQATLTSLTEVWSGVKPSRTRGPNLACSASMAMA